MTRLLTILMLMCGCAVPAISAQDKAMLAGRAWKVVKSEFAPPGTTMIFGADGKLSLTMVVDGKEQQMTGTYTLTGKELILKFTNSGREMVDARVIKSLSDSSLITVNKNQKIEELQR